MQTNIVFSQFLGGGTGTASDPYRIYNIQHLEILRDSMAAHGGFWNNYSYLTGKHLRLMNDITDSLTFIISDYNTPLNAFFHGGGHFINCKILNNINSNPNAIFGRVSSYATIDSLALYGVIYLMKGFTLINDGLISNCINNVPLIGLNGTNLNDEVFGICHQNVGTLLNCVNNADIITTQGAGICQSNSGSMINCINNGNIMGIVQNDIVDVAGLCFALNFENASISNCINNGNITISGIAPYSVIGGLVCRDYGGGLANINNSVNTGNIDAKSCYTNGGIIGMGSANVTNCANYGNITNSQYAGGIFGTNGDAINGHSIVIIENCFNSGEINGINNSGGLVGRIDPIENSHLNNCVNIGKVNNTGFALFGNQTNAIYGSPYLTISNNYYDKQMVTKPATVIGDIPGQAEGKLTTQLTGIGTELQAMLGNGWSYAEGRYPIPLGLENDSAAILAATPMYLHFTDTVNFNTVDSVSQDFTVGMENNVAWQVAGNKVILQNENAILQSIGNEQLTVSRGTYSKNISIHIVQAPEIQTFTISGTVTSNAIPLENVIISYSEGQILTDIDGNYSITINENSTITITPSLTGYIFEPQQITLTDIQQNYPNQNFTANLISLDSENFTNILVYPNPAKDEMNISGIENPQVTISDLSGRIILTTNSSKINISNLSEGMYILQIENKMIKFIKK